LLVPMSEVAGRMAIQVAAHYLERPQGGRGVLVSGATGVPPARILVLGSGVVGTNAASVAVGMGAEVVVIGCSAETLSHVTSALGSAVRTGISSPAVVERELRSADAVIGAALLPGALTPKLVTRPMLAGMRRGAVMVDVSIDQGGCFETSRPTTHSEPIYEVEGVLHYCVANMPGAVPHTSTYALNHATLPFVIQLADLGVVEALAANAHLRNGLNVCHGAVTHRGVAEALGYPFIDPLTAIGAARNPR